MSASTSLGARPTFVGTAEALPLPDASVDAVVLGCTHYPFIARQIREVVGDVPLFDGAYGTALQLQRKLAERGLTTKSSGRGAVEFLSSKPGEDEIELYRSFFESS